jgi:predicted nucleic acid-binding protein
LIVVDTSVWITSLRQPSGETSETLKGILDADEVALPVPVRVELLSGIAKKERLRVQRALSGLPVLAINDETWSILEEFVNRAADAGQRFTITDLLIASAAREIGALVWSLDSDFERMERAGLVQLYQ